MWHTGPHRSLNYKHFFGVRDIILLKILSSQFLCNWLIWKISIKIIRHAFGVQRIRKWHGILLLRKVNRRTTVTNSINSDISASEYDKPDQLSTERRSTKWAQSWNYTFHRSHHTFHRIKKNKFPGRITITELKEYKIKTSFVSSPTYSSFVSSITLT
jgi:hypothetical protein